MKSAVVEKGIITRQDGNEANYEMAFLDESYSGQVNQLQDEIVEEINDPVFYDPVAPEDIEKRFGREGRIIGTFADQRLIACRIIHFPPPGGDNFGIDINLPEKELPDVAHLAGVLVLPLYRRNALAFAMNLHAIDAIKSLGYRHLCSTVFPGNLANVATQFKTGLFIRGLKNKYGGKPRYIFYQDLQKPVVVEARESKTISIEDIEYQKQLLEEGYLGYNLTMSPDALEIHFSKYTLVLENLTSLFETRTECI